MPPERRVVVLGAGVSGLTSALLLAEAGWPVRVWTAALPRQTTSAVAGAVWAPPRPGSAKTLDWSKHSLHAFRELADDPASGVRMAPALIVGEMVEPEVFSALTELVPDVRQADPVDVPGGSGPAFHATLPMIDMPHYLDYLARRVRAAGVEIERRSARSLDDAASAAPIVVNCTGLGARDLTGDDTLRPLFGQHVVLANPGLRRLFVEMHQGDEWVGFFPHPERVVCGGIRIADRWDTAADPAISERILQRCRRVEPRLGEADVIETITGLRPYRPSVRVEAERLGAGWCVHNYGHGGNGVTLSWGCARDVVGLVEGLEG